MTDETLREAWATDMDAMRCVEDMVGVYVGSSRAGEAANDIIAKLRLSGFTITRGRAAPAPAPTVDAALTPEELLTVFTAHRIGAISYDGDSWFAADAGYDYDSAEATMQAAGEILARLSRAALRASAR